MTAMCFRSRIDYVNTVKEKENIKDKNVSAIDIERAMGAPERIREIVKYTLEHFDQKTKPQQLLFLEGQAYGRASMPCSLSAPFPWQ